MTEQNETATSDSSPETAEELDDLFLSPEDSEGEVVAEVDASGEVQPAGDTETGDDDVIDMPIAAASGEELDEAKQQIKALAEERDDVKNRMIRVAADLENFRKRAAREREDLRKYGIDKVVLELLPVLDNLERALLHSEQNAEDNSITEGVRMVYRQFVAALQKHGVEGFESRGEQFDPQRHEAIQQVETEEFETGTVMEEYQKGYFLHERLIRPAMVSVAKNVAGTSKPTEHEGEGEPAPEESVTASAREESAMPSEVPENGASASESESDEESEGLEEKTDVGS